MGRMGLLYDNDAIFYNIVDIFFIFDRYPSLVLYGLTAIKGYSRYLDIVDI